MPSGANLKKFKIKDGKCKIWEVLIIDTQIYCRDYNPQAYCLTSINPLSVSEHKTCKQNTN